MGSSLVNVCTFIQGKGSVFLEVACDASGIMPENIRGIPLRCLSSLNCVRSNEGTNLRTMPPISNGTPGTRLLETRAVFCSQNAKRRRKACLALSVGSKNSPNSSIAIGTDEFRPWELDVRVMSWNVPCLH